MLLSRALLLHGSLLGRLLGARLSCGGLLRRPLLLHLLRTLLGHLRPLLRLLSGALLSLLRPCLGSLLLLRCTLLGRLLCRRALLRRLLLGCGSLLRSLLSGLVLLLKLLLALLLRIDRSGGRRLSSRGGRRVCLLRCPRRRNGWLAGRLRLTDPRIDERAGGLAGSRRNRHSSRRRYRRQQRMSAARRRWRARLHLRLSAGGWQLP